METTAGKPAVLSFQTPKTPVFRLAKAFFWWENGGKEREERGGIPGSISGFETNGNDMSRMKDVPKIERPRERMEKYGPEKLKDEELLAILLGSGTKGLNVVQLSKRILKRIRIFGVEKLSHDELLKERGLGKAKAGQIIALLELGKRLSAEDQSEILSSEDIWKRCEDIRESKREHFLAFYLDTQGRVIERQIISIGTLNASLVHPREVFEPAVSLHAASVIVAHNHPSGETNPSSADIALTKRLAEAGKILGIPLDDHVIVSKKSHISLKNHL